jgi:hypothetical protein
MVHLPGAKLVVVVLVVLAVLAGQDLRLVEWAVLVERQGPILEQLQQPLPIVLLPVEEAGVVNRLVARVTVPTALRPVPTLMAVH